MTHRQIFSTLMFKGFYSSNKQGWVVQLFGILMLTVNTTSIAAGFALSSENNSCSELVSSNDLKEQGLSAVQLSKLDIGSSSNFDFNGYKSRAKNLTSMGVSAFGSRNWDEAERNYLQSLAELRADGEATNSLGDMVVTYYNYHFLSLVYGEKKMGLKSAEMAHYALVVAKLLDDKDLLSGAYEGMATTCGLLGDEKKMQSSLDAAIELFEQLGNLEKVAMLKQLPAKLRFMSRLNALSEDLKAPLQSDN